jgi:hypothetical protein
MGENNMTYNELRLVLAINLVVVNLLMIALSFTLNNMGFYFLAAACVIGESAVLASI